jgi:hypothetical protein
MERRMLRADTDVDDLERLKLTTRSVLNKNVVEESFILELQKSLVLSKYE